MLHDLIKQHKENQSIRVYLFGSHAKGNAHKFSDIDIALSSDQPLPAHFITHLKEKIEDSTIPYTVDIIDLADVDETFRKKILAEAIEWKD